MDDLVRTNQPCATLRPVQDDLFHRASPFTTREAVGLGLTRRRLERAVACGDVQRVFRGVFVGGAVTVDASLRARALQHVLPQRSCVVHESAAELWGVDCWPPGPPPEGPRDVQIGVRPGHRLGDRPGVRVVEARLRPADVTVRRGVRLTTPARTAIDLARRKHLVDAVVSVDAFLRHGCVTAADLAEQVRVAGEARWIATAREALRLADARSESPMETRLRVVLVEAGLPAPELQHEIRDRDGRFLARVDLAYVVERIAIEYDGVEAHLEPGRFLHDRHRHHDLREQGWEVLRFTADDVLRDPDGVVARVRRVLVARRLG